MSGKGVWTDLVRVVHLRGLAVLSTAVKAPLAELATLACVTCE